MFCPIAPAKIPRKFQEVGFYDGDPAQGGPLICSATTGQDLQPGQCTLVECLWLGAPLAEPHDLAVVVDPNSQRTECIEGNNLAWIRGAACSYP